MIPFVLGLRVGKEGVDKECVGKEKWKSCVVEGRWDGENVGLDKADTCSSTVAGL